MEIIAQEMVTDLPSSFGDSFLDLSGYSMAKKAASQCYRKTGLNPTDVDVLEVHDCFSCNEVNKDLRILSYYCVVSLSKDSFPKRFCFGFSFLWVFTF